MAHFCLLHTSVVCDSLQALCREQCLRYLDVFRTRLCKGIELALVEIKLFPVFKRKSSGTVGKFVYGFQAATGSCVRPPWQRPDSEPILTAANVRVLNINSPFFNQKQPFFAAAHGNDTTLEKRIVAP